MLKRLRYILYLSLPALFLFSCSKEEKKGSVWDDPSMWYQSESPFSPDKTDVIYFVSTDVLSARDKDGNVAWQSQLIPSDVEALREEIEDVEGNMFYNDFNFSAPYYHQFTFDAIWQLSRKDFKTIYGNVAKEACDAFDYYMDKVNRGRPFVLAGYSQGAMLTVEILKHMTDEQYSRMIACYTMGYRLSAEDLVHPHIKAATGETDKGVTISYNSVQTRDAVWPFLTEGAATCINPVNWKTDSTPAQFTYDGTANEVHVDSQSHVLLVRTDNPQYFYEYYRKSPFYDDAGVSHDNLHHWDRLFYSRMIHDNALKRAGIYNGSGNGEETNGDKDNLNMKMKAGGYSFDIEYADNNTVEAFRKMLPVTLRMEELNGNEKYCYMDSSLPAASGNPGTINAGDIMLYGNNCVVVFYETFNTSYSYTRIGRIKNTANLKKALGSGNVEVTFE